MRYVPPKFRLVALFFAAVTSFPAVTLAEYVALVEDASSESNYKAFDLLQDGLVIDLGADQFINLGYFGSCLSEHIVGGRVIIGRFRSTVFGSQVTRDTVSCDGGRLILEPDQLAQSGVDVFRGADGILEFIVYDEYPILIGKFVNGEFDFIDEASGVRDTLSGNAGILDFSVIDRELKTGNSYLVTREMVSYRITIVEPANGDFSRVSSLSRIVRLP